MMTFVLSPTPLEHLNIRKGFTSPKAGAFSSFEGLVRDTNEGKSVTALEYEAHEPLCRKEALKILQEAKDQFNGIDIKAAHRVGRLKIGETAVWVGVLAAHRDDSFKACRYVIDELKKRLPIWKKEYYADGNSGWIGSAPGGPSSCVIDLRSLPKKALKDYVFIDIREDEECAANPAKEIRHLRLPLSRFAESNFSFDAAKRYILFCAKGKRSLRLTEDLRGQGLTNIFSLEGGIEAIHEYFQTHAQKN